MLLVIFSNGKIGALEELRIAVEKLTAQYNEGEDLKKEDSLVSRDHHFHTLLMEVKHSFAEAGGEKLLGRRKVAKTAGVLKDTKARKGPILPNILHSAQALTIIRDIGE